MCSMLVHEDDKSMGEVDFDRDYHHADQLIRRFSVGRLLSL